MWIIDRDKVDGITLSDVNGTKDSIAATLNYDDGGPRHLYIGICIHEKSIRLLDKDIHAITFLDPDTALLFAERLAEMAKRCKNTLTSA